MSSLGTNIALILLGASAMYGLVLIAFGRARRQMPLSWFAISCTMMVVYSLIMVAVTVPDLPDWLVSLTGPLGYVSAIVYTVTLTRYLRARLSVNISPFERMVDWLLLAAATTALVPGLIYETGEIRKWTAFGTRLHLPETTPLAFPCCFFILLGLVCLMRLVVKTRSRSLFAGCVAVTLCGSNDMAISLALYNGVFAAAAGAMFFLVVLALHESKQWGNEANELTELKNTLQDRVERRSRSLAETSERLAKSQQLATLGRLAACIGHEINNPLTYVMSNLELLRIRHEGIDAEEIDDALEGTQRIADIVAQLRILSRRPGSPTQPWELQLILSTAAKTLRPTLHANHRIELQCEPSVFVQGEKGRLTQVFINLFSNAIQSMPDNGVHTVTAKVTTTEEHVTIHVEDDGRGIAPELQQRLFEPFETNRPGGLGLGLAIVQTIIDEMDGSIQVRNSSVQGTQFEVKLPKSLDPTEAGLASPTASVVFSPSKRILVIDDEIQILNSVAKMLNQHEFTGTSDPENALELLRSHQFDVVLCDLVMPHLTGLDILNQTLDDNPRYAGRFIFMSGGAPSDELRHQLTRSNTRFLHKPFHQDDLFREIASI